MGERVMGERGNGKTLERLRYPGFGARVRVA